MSLDDFIANISEADLKKLNEEFYKKQNKIPTYQYSKIKFNDLKSLVTIQRKINHAAFETWFQPLDINTETNLFLQNLINDNIDLIENYNEEDLKIKFLSPILNRIHFKSIKHQLRDFYELPLHYKTEHFIFNGTADFAVAKGLFEGETPYFFIQEFKKGHSDGFPEPQLLAELITAVELNQWDSIKGAYIRGSLWHFVILERLAKHDYRYFVSHNFDSTKINDLTAIYNNLLFIKHEILDLTR